MKRLLLVLILLCVFIPVNAKGTAFVYKMKEADTGMDTQDGSSWEKYKDNYTGYVIIEPNDNNTARVLPINTWTDKATKQKYYEQRDMMTFGFLQALVGKNTVWIMTYADDVNGGESFMFSGRAKPVNVATPKPSIAATLTATTMWFDEEGSSIDVGSGKMSLSMDTLLTTYGYTHTGEETVANVISYLENTLHYLPGTQ
ncbi:MAG: hypothetical protein ABSG97_03885 [Sedimentisphaerales bacterium]|jgi:hypothetical protein